MKKKNQFNFANLRNRSAQIFARFKKSAPYQRYRALLTKADPYLNPVIQHLNKSSMYYILGLIIMIYSLLTSPQFAIIQPDNFVGSLLQNNTSVFIIAMPMLMVIISGNIDLSVGRFLGFLGTVSVLLFNRLASFASNGIGPFIATFLIIILLGAFLGAAQGILIGYAKIPAFIVTLGAMLLFQGLTLYALTTGRGDTSSTNVSILGEIESVYAKFAQAVLPDYRINNEFYIGAFIFFLVIASLLVGSAFLRRKATQKYGLATVSKTSFYIKQAFVFAAIFSIGLLFAFSSRGLRTYVIYIFLAIALMYFILNNTKFGRGVYAIGGNQKTAELSGINPRFYKVLIFMIMGMYIAFASLVNSGILLNAQVDTGAGHELLVISAVFVGGASVAGGIGTIAGTVVGVLVINIISNGSVLLSLGADITNITTGIVLIAAVAYDVISHRKL